MMPESPKLREEEPFFSRHLVNQLPDPVFCLGSDACFLYLNDAACRQLEYSRQELLSMRLSDIDLNFQQKNWSEQWQDLSQQGSLVVESQYQTKSGKILSVKLTLVYIEERGEFSCAFVREVEETKSDRTLDSYMPAVSLRDNGSQTRALGNSSIRETLALDSSFKGCDPALSEGVSFRAPSGARINRTMARERAPRGNPPNGLSRNGRNDNLYQDSQLKEKAQTAKTLCLLRGILDSTAYGTIAISYEGEVLSHNQKFLEIWKIPDSLVLSKDSEECQDFFARQLKNPEVFRRSFWEVSRESEAETYDILELKNGRVFAQYSKPQRLDDKIIGRVWSIWDITELEQQTESKLQKTQDQIETLQATEKAKQLSELRSRFLSMVCHQFRSSLNIVSFSNSLLKRYADKWTDDKKLPYLDNIQTAVEQIAKLLDELVFFGKSEVGQIEFEPKSVDLTGFCRTLIAQLQSLSDSKEQTIEFFSRGNCQAASIDENILHHILTNLLSNSIKYSPNCSKIELEVLCEPEQAIIKIKDKGIGIPEVDQSRLFDPFFRGSNVDSIPGSGLGLSIVKNLVEIHGGKIELESKVGIGSTFLLILPVRNLEDKRQSAESGSND